MAERCRCIDAKRNRRLGYTRDPRYVANPTITSEDGEVSCVFCWELIVDIAPSPSAAKESE